MDGVRVVLDFNPRSPHGERLSCIPQLARNLKFQSTLPARGATTRRLFSIIFKGISIHAPRTGSDQMPTIRLPIHLTFQSTLPARGATAAGFAPCRTFVFQSTLPARGATIPAYFFRQNSIISIHAPRTGSDSVSVLSVTSGVDFNPRSPHGERPVRRAPLTPRS